MQRAPATGSRGIIQAAGKVLVDQKYKLGFLKQNVGFSLENGDRL